MSTNGHDAKKARERTEHVLSKQKIMKRGKRVKN